MDAAKSMPASSKSGGCGTLMPGAHGLHRADMGRSMMRPYKICGGTLQLAVGAGDFGEEIAEFVAVFFARSCFDAAGDIDGVGSDAEDGFGHVFWREAACEDDAMGFCGAAGDSPVGANAGAAVLAGFGGVEEECADDRLKRFELREAEAFADAHGFRDVEIFRGRASGGDGFVAVELHGVEIDGASERDDRLG